MVSVEIFKDDLNMGVLLDKELLKEIYNFLLDELVGENKKPNVSYNKGLEDLYNKFALFEDAEFNDLFITKDGKKASFIKTYESDYGTDIYVLYVEDEGLRRFYDNGTSLLDNGTQKNITIVGRYDKK